MMCIPITVTDHACISKTKLCFVILQQEFIKYSINKQFTPSFTKLAKMLQYDTQIFNMCSKADK